MTTKMGLQQREEQERMREVNVRLPQELFDELAEFCERTRTPRATMVRQWVAEKLEEARRAQADDARRQRIADDGR